jgi:hypothetical protein
MGFEKFPAMANLQRREARNCMEEFPYIKAATQS